MILNFCKVCPVNCWNNQFKVPDQCHEKNKEWNSISFPWSTSHFSPFQSNLDVFGGGQPGVSHFSRSGDFQMDPMSLVSNLFRLREWKQLLSRDRVDVFNLLSIIRLTNDGFQAHTGTLWDSLAFLLLVSVDLEASSHAVLHVPWEGVVVETNGNIHALLLLSLFPWFMTLLSRSVDTIHQQQSFYQTWKIFTNHPSLTHAQAKWLAWGVMRYVGWERRDY